ncbi:hypothetical protein PSPO01_13670 [Paraphaeosphaeria sporulosa]
MAITHQPVLFVGLYRERNRNLQRTRKHGCRIPQKSLSALASAPATGLMLGFGTGCSSLAVPIGSGWSLKACARRVILAVFAVMRLTCASNLLPREADAGCGYAIFKVK